MPDKHASQKRIFYINKIKQCKSQCDDEAFNSRSIFDLKELQSSLRSVHEKFENKCLAVQCDGESDLSEQQQQALNKENDEIDSLCLQLKAKISMRLDDLVDKKYALPSAHADTQSVTFNAFQNIEQSMGKVSVGKGVKKSEKIEIDLHFDENTDDFESFIEIFEQKIKCISLSEEEKGELLKKACKDKALQLIQHLNYQAAVEKLHTVYGQAYENAHKSLKKLYDIKPMESSTSENMRALLNDILACENEFAKITQEDKFDMILMLLTVEKFDKATKRVWERFRLSLAESWASQSVESESNIVKKASQHIPSFDDVKQFITSEIKILKIDERENMQTQHQASNMIENSQCEKLKYADVAKTQQSSVIVTKAMDQPSGQSNTLAEEKAKSPAFLQCKLCPRIHPAYKCDVYKALPLHKRVEYVKNQKLCVKCLRSQHTGDCVDAKSNKHCPICQVEVFHNSTLCDTKAAKEGKQTSVSEESWD